MNIMSYYNLIQLIDIRMNFWYHNVIYDFVKY